MPNSSKKSAKKPTERSHHYAIIIYPESISNDWIERLNSLNIPCAISPLHDKDLQENGEPKKPHHHVLFAFRSLKSLNQVLKICEFLGISKYAEIVQDINSYHAYLTHKYDPQKAQYSETDIQYLNGFDPRDYKSLKELKAEDRQILKDIQKFVKDNGIIYYCDLLDYCMEHNDRWYELLTEKYTYIAREYIKSYAHSISKGHNL